MTYKKPEVKIYADVPTAGGCGDKGTTSCGEMVYMKNGGGCGDWCTTSCGKMVYKN